MSESWKEVLDALSDEDDRMAVLIGVVQFEKRKENILELLRYNMEISTRARLARELVEIRSFTEKKKTRRYQEAPILNLPFDVLSEIALVFSRVQENGAWPFSAVCRAWRETVLSTPRAWTNIHLRAGYSGSYHQLSYTIPHRHCTSRIPDPALCIQRAGIFPFHLELHELSSDTPNLPEFILRIMPHVQYLYIYESAGSEVSISRPAPKLKELQIIRSQCTTDILDGDLKNSSLLLLDLLGPAAPYEWEPTFSRLQVARFDGIVWQHQHLAAFRQLRVLTLNDCDCEAVDHLHELLRNNCKTLEHLYLSVSTGMIPETQEFQPILLPKLRKLSFIVACEALNPHISLRAPLEFIISHATGFFQSLVIPEVMELQVFAPCIQNLNLGTHFPSLQHLHIIIPETIDDISFYVRNLSSLLTVAPLQTIDLFIATYTHRPPEVKYNMAMVLGAFLCHPFVLEHPILTSFTLKSEVDFEPLRGRVRPKWTRANKQLHIDKATDEECQSSGFTMPPDVIPCW